MVNRFSRLAQVSFCLLLVTGVYQSWIQVGSLNILISTNYGNVLLLKVALFPGHARVRRAQFPVD